MRKWIAFLALAVCGMVVLHLPISGTQRGSRAATSIGGAREPADALDRQEPAQERVAEAEPEQLKPHPTGEQYASATEELLRQVIFEPRAPLREFLERPGQFLPDLVRFVEGDDLELQRRAIYVMGELRGKARAQTGLLRRLLHSQDADTRYLASIALAKIAPLSEGYLPTFLLARRRARPWRARDDAAAVMDELRPVLLDRLHASLASEDADVRLAAFLQLRVVEDRAEVLLPLLRRGLRGHNAYYARGASAILCAAIAPRTPGLVKPLLDMLQAAEWEYGARAVDALRQIGARDDETVHALIAALRTAHYHVQSRAARLLGDLGRRPEETVSALVQAVADAKNGGVRAAAAHALTAFPDRAPTFIPVLVEALHEEWRWRDKRHGVWRTPRGCAWAAEALGVLGARAKETVPDLIRALEYDGPGVWKSAIDALGRMGPEAAPAVPALIRTLQYEPAKVLEAARWDPERQAYRRAWARFRQYHEDNIAERAIVALGRIGPAAAGALPALQAELEAGHEGAAEAIARIRKH